MNISIYIKREYTFAFQAGDFQVITVYKSVIGYNFLNIQAKKGWNEYTD